MESPIDGRQNQQTFVRNLIQRTQMMNRQLNQDIEETTKTLSKITTTDSSLPYEQAAVNNVKEDFRPLQKTILSFFSGLTTNFEQNTKKTNKLAPLKFQSSTDVALKISRDNGAKTRDCETNNTFSNYQDAVNKKRLQRQKYIRGNCFIRNISNLSRSTLSLFTRESLFENQKNVGAKFGEKEIKPEPTRDIVSNNKSFERNLIKRSITLSDLTNSKNECLSENIIDCTKTTPMTSLKCNKTAKTNSLDKNSSAEIGSGSCTLRSKLCDNTTLPSSTATKHKIKLIKNDSIKRASSIKRTRSTKRTVTERIYELFDKYDDHKNYDSIQKYRKEWNKYRNSRDPSLSNQDVKTNDFGRYSRMKDRTKKLIQGHRGFSGSEESKDDDFPDESPFFSIKASNEFLQELRSQDDIGGQYVMVKKK